MIGEKYLGETYTLQLTIIGEISKLSIQYGYFFFLNLLYLQGSLIYKRLERQINMFFLVHIYIITMSHIEIDSHVC